MLNGNPDKCRYCRGEILEEWGEWVCCRCARYNGNVVGVVEHNGPIDKESTL